MSYVLLRRKGLQMLLLHLVLIGLFACSPALTPTVEVVPATEVPTEIPTVEAAPTDQVPATIAVTSMPELTPIPAELSIAPIDIPRGYGYPGDRTLLQKWADEWQIEKITDHAWHLWAGMTADSGEKWENAALPYWETWCGSEEAFSHQCNEGKTRAPAHKFIPAVQLNHNGHAAQADAQIVTFNKFNPAMAGFLSEKHKGPGGVEYDYTLQSSLVALNSAWPADTLPKDRKIIDTPYTPTVDTVQGSAAIETKPVIFVVKAKGLTPLPLWQGLSDSATPNSAGPASWKTCILLDPENSGGTDTKPVPATDEQIKNAYQNSSLSCEKYLYAPLAVIWGFKMSEGDAAAWNTVNGSSADAGEGLPTPDPNINCQEQQKKASENKQIIACAGDWAVLVAMHVNSKEIVNWTWQTFWWQPGGDTPNNYPGNKQGMTDDIKGPWRNYAMCTAWNQTQGSKSDKLHVCFNPYLETSVSIPSGQNSNCMSCHGMASVSLGTPNCVVNQNNPPILNMSTLPYPANYDAPEQFGAAGFTTTDFSWAIPSDSNTESCVLPTPAPTK